MIGTTQVLLDRDADGKIIKTASLGPMLCLLSECMNAMRKLSAVGCRKKLVEVEELLFL